MNAATVHTATTTSTLPKAAFWDMDGTLVDTEPYWIEAEMRLVSDHGGYWDVSLAHQLVGSALDRSALILQEAGVKLSVREIIDHLSESVIGRVRESLPWRPGARELLADLHAAGVRCALVTMSERALASEIVAALDHEYFEFLVTGDEVAHGKPHPEPYLKAIEAMRSSDPSLGAADCVVFEDSIPGAASGMESGALTIVVPHAVAVPEDPRHVQWETLVGKTSSDVASLLAQRTSLGAAL